MRSPRENKNETKTAALESDGLIRKHIQGRQILPTNEAEEKRQTARGPGSWPRIAFPSLCGLHDKTLVCSKLYILYYIYNICTIILYV